MSSLTNLSDKQLVEAYVQAVKLNLDEYFVNMLHDELLRRKIVPEPKTKDTGK